MNRHAASLARPQLAAIGMAAVMTLSVLAALAALADGYHADAMLSLVGAQPAAHQVVVEAGRPAPKS